MVSLYLLWQRAYSTLSIITLLYYSGGLLYIRLVTLDSLTRWMMMIHISRYFGISQGLMEHFEGDRYYI